MNCRGILLRSLLLLTLIVARIAVAEEVVIDDPLQGSTVGTLVGGGFSNEGYVPGPGQSHILYRLPRTIANGCVEFEVRGMVVGLIPSERTAEQGFWGMYDGRGVQEPAE